MRVLCFVAVAIGLAVSAPSTMGQQGEPHRLAVQTASERVINESDVRAILTEMSRILADDEDGPAGDRDVSCELEFDLDGPITAAPQGTPKEIGSENDADEVRVMSFDVLIVDEINWCYNEDPAEGSLEVGGSNTITDDDESVQQEPSYLGCSFGNRFAVVASATALPWLHELGHIQRIDHREEKGFVMSEHDTALGGKINSDECAKYRSDLP